MSLSCFKDKSSLSSAKFQSDSGLGCPTLTGSTRPVDSLPQFDSRTWPIATTILESETGSADSADVNIFIDKTTDIPRSIDEIVDSFSTWRQSRMRRKGLLHERHEGRQTPADCRTPERGPPARWYFTRACCQDARPASAIISEMEAGKSPNFRHELARLAQIYDVSVAWLLGEAAGDD